MHTIIKSQSHSTFFSRSLRTHCKLYLNKENPAIQLLATPRCLLKQASPSHGQLSCLMPVPANMGRRPLSPASQGHPFNSTAIPASAYSHLRSHQDSLGDMAVPVCIYKCGNDCVSCVAVRTWVLAHFASQWRCTDDEERGCDSGGLLTECVGCAERWVIHC